MTRTVEAVFPKSVGSSELSVAWPRHVGATHPLKEITMGKTEELRRRVGNTESHFCGRQKKSTPHIWIEKDITAIRFLTHRYSAFYLRCKEFGYTDEVYTNRPM